MRAINRPPSRFAQIRYPKETPRISRKRVWIDRSEWRKDPAMVGQGSEGMIDQQLQRARDVGSLEQENYMDLADLTDRAGRVGLKKL